MATLEDLKQWKDFLKSNYEVLYTSLNFSDVLLRHLCIEGVLSELECGTLLGIPCQQTYERASRFLSMMETDVVSVKFLELVRVLEHPLYRCSIPAALFRKYAESKNICLLAPSDRTSSLALLQPTLPTATSTVQLLNTWTSTPKPSIADMLNPCISFQQLTEMAFLNPTALSQALPQIISQRYMGKVSTFRSILEFVEGLPGVEIQIIGCSAIYTEIQRFKSLPQLPLLARLADTAKRLQKCAPRPRLPTDTSSDASKLSELFYGLSPLIITGESGKCFIHSVAYQRSLITCDGGWPKSVFVYYTDQVYKGAVQIFPAVRNNQLVFRIGTVLRDGNAVLLYASDNPNPNSWIRFITKPSERYVLWTHQNMLPANAEIYWKFVPVEDKANTFRILSAEFEDTMFVHKSATSKLLTGNRRVLLGMKGYSNHEHIPYADQWTLEGVSSN